MKKTYIQLILDIGNIIKYAICSTEWHKIHQKNAICEQLADQNTHLIKNVLSPIKTDDLQLREESNS